MPRSTGSPMSELSRRSLLHGGAGAGALAALTSLTLASCSNEGRGGDAVGDNADAILPDHIPLEGVEPDLSGADGVPDAILAYPEDPPEVVEGTPGDGEEVGFFVMTNGPAPPGVEDNEYWQALNERLGCEVDVSVVPNGDFDDRFQTAIAGDRLPDIFSFYPADVPSLPSMLSERATDLTDLLSGDAVANYPCLANLPTENWVSTLSGGKIYGIPIPRGSALSSVMYVRADLLDELGVEIGTDSWEAFHDSCKEFTGGNQWALPEASIGFIRQMFEIPNTWAADGGTLTSAYEHERQEEALEAGRRLVEEGLVHPDAFSVDQLQRKTWVAAGTCALIQDTFTAQADFLNFSIPEGFELAITPPPLADGGGTAPIHLGAPTHNIAAISKKSEDRAEALLKIINYLAAPIGSAEYLFKKYGLEGVHHDLDGTDPVLNEKGRNELQLAIDYAGSPPWVTYIPGARGMAESQFDAQTELVPTAVPNPVQGLYSETQSRKGTQIGTALADLETDILQGRKPVSDWAKGVETWKKGGGDDIRDEYQEALAELEEV